MSSLARFENLQRESAEVFFAERRKDVTKSEMRDPARAKQEGIWEAIEYPRGKAKLNALKLETQPSSSISEKESLKKTQPLPQLETMEEPKNQGMVLDDIDLCDSDDEDRTDPYKKIKAEVIPHTNRRKYFTNLKECTNSKYLTQEEKLEILQWKIVREKVVIKNSKDKLDYKFINLQNFHV